MVLGSHSSMSKIPPRNNLSVPKMDNRQHLARTQYDKMMSNFEKDSRVNAQKIKECLELENARKVYLKKLKNKEEARKVSFCVKITPSNISIC